MEVTLPLLTRYKIFTTVGYMHLQHNIFVVKLSYYACQYLMGATTSTTSSSIGWVGQEAKLIYAVLVSREKLIRG